MRALAVLVVLSLAGCPEAQTVDAPDAARSDARRFDAPLAIDARGPDAPAAPDARAADARAPDARACPQGCCTASDCPLGNACDTGTHVCGKTCSADKPCNGGCCGADGMCHDGRTDKLCGKDSAMCVDCAGAAEGPKCRFAGNGGQCGCNAIGDCPVHQTCSFDTFTCGTTCIVDPQFATCNGGCCDPKTKTCVAGTATTACGENGSVCSSCATDRGGPTCIAFDTGGDCGCTDDPGQCKPPAICQSLQFEDVKQCCLPKGAACGVAEDCCSRFCVMPGGCQ